MTKKDQKEQNMDKIDLLFYKKNNKEINQIFRIPAIRCLRLKRINEMRAKIFNST